MDHRTGTDRLGSLRTKGTAEAEGGISDTPVRAMVFQLKDKPPPKFPVTPGIPDKFPREGAVKLFETDRLVVWDYVWKTGMKTPLHLHYKVDAAVYLRGQDTSGHEPADESAGGASAQLGPRHLRSLIQRDNMKENLVPSRLSSSNRMLAVAIAALIVAAIPTAWAQDRGAKGPHLRRLPATLVDPPRTADGQPDFQGEWTPTGRNGNPYHSIEEGSDPGSVVIQGLPASGVAGSFANLIVDPPDGTIPYQPWAAAKRKEYLQNYMTPTKREHIPPDIRCIEGLPHQNYVIGTFQILERPGFVVFIYGGDNYRVVPMDGRPHVGDGIKMYMGDSRGRWEGNTLVVDVTNNNDKIWLDSHGTIRTDAAHLTERWTMVSPTMLFYEVTVEDSKAFTRPLKLAITFDRLGKKGERRRCGKRPAGRENGARST